MDIILKPVLNFIQEQDGMTNAVLAGGAVRDSLFGLEPKDYDIFVPSLDRKKVRLLVDALKKEFPIEAVTDKTVEYGMVFSPTAQVSLDGRNLTQVYNFKYKEREVDVIGIIADDDDEFGSNAVKNFDFGINMVYDNGRYVDDSNENFKFDFETYTMTLHRLNSIYDLPRAMVRFQRFHDRLKASGGGSINFASSVLSVTSKEVKKDGYFKKKYYTEEATQLVPPEQWGQPVMAPTPDLGLQPITNGLVGGGPAINTIATNAFINTVATNNTMNPFDNN